MFEKLNTCPLCQSGQFSNHIICKDYSITKEDFAIVQCDHCNLHFTNPRPIASELPRYYRSENYISHQNNKKGVISILYQLARHFTLRNKVNLLRKYHSTGQLLDYGSGTGHFLQAASKVYQTQGIEPNREARTYGQNLGLTIHEQIEELNSSYKPDLITLWHVLEHLPDINTVLERLHTILTRSGHIIIAVPNINSFDQKYYGKHWAAYDVPRHLYHFSQDTLVKLLKRHKFKLKEIKPMKLDSYYVSMLSEKYKNQGKLNLISALVNGYKSNAYAKLNNNNYSSLIYIFSK